jgi:hypothetical protein
VAPLPREAREAEPE